MTQFSMIPETRLIFNFGKSLYRAGNFLTKIMTQQKLKFENINMNYEFELSDSIFRKI